MYEYVWLLIRYYSTSSFKLLDGQVQSHMEAFLVKKNIQKDEFPPHTQLLRLYDL